MSSNGRTGMSAETAGPERGFPAPSLCTRILLGVILASRSGQADQDHAAPDVDCDPFSDPPVSPLSCAIGGGP
jgi:hypothetical protein